MQDIQYIMHVNTNDTDHGYWKEIVKENVSCVFISCQFNLAVLEKIMFEDNG